MSNLYIFLFFQNTREAFKKKVGKQKLLAPIDLHGFPVHAIEVHRDQQVFVNNYF